MIYQIENLIHRYRGRQVLAVDRLAVARGSLVGLVGPNGSGKSTLLRLLAFLETPSDGRVVFNGGASADAAQARLQVTLLQQDPYLLKRSVLDNVVYGLKTRGERQALRERAAAALTWVGLEPERFLQRRWYELSGGEAQRVALAARLILRPRALLLDEPTANVDGDSAQLIQEAVLRARRQWGTTLVISSHDWFWLFEVCDTVLQLVKGRLVGSGGATLIPGPWTRRSDGLWVKHLEDGSDLVLPGVPHADATAVIDAARVELAAQDDAPSARRPEPSNQVRIVGTLTRLSFARATGAIVATVSAAGQLTVTARLSSQPRSGPVLYPGGRVIVRFPAAAVEWLE